MALMRRLIVATALVCLTSAASLPSLRHADWRAPGPGWARGPVWYVMTNTEYRSYRRLRLEPQRRNFIRVFWEQRDPIPDTPENELEREFWERVRLADNHFGQEVKPGWKTERGKVLIMIGPPDNLEQDSLLRDTWGSSRWFYDLGSMPVQLRLVLQDSLGIPTDRRFVNLKVRAETPGSRSVAGGVAVQNSVLRPTDFLPLAEILVRRMPGPGALRNLGHVMRVPEVLERSRSQVDVTSVFSLIPVQARIDFRPAARAATTLVAVTLGVSQTELAAAGVPSPGSEGALLTGYLTPVADESRSYPLKGSFAPRPAGDPPAGEEDTIAHVFQALTEVPPGRYLLDVAYHHTDERIMGALRDLIDVPAFSSEGLRVSSLILSSRIEPLGQPAAESPISSFSLGRYRVIPRTNKIYEQPERLKVFYQVYGAQADSEGLAHLDLTYQFYVQDADAWLPVGPAITVRDQQALAQIWQVPLDGWPAGRYRLEVTVADTLAGSVMVRGTLFEIGSPSAE